MVKLEPFRNKEFFHNLSFFNSSNLGFEIEHIFFSQFSFIFSPLGSGSVDSDPDPGSHNAAELMDPDLMFFTLRGWCTVFIVKVPRMKTLRGWCSVYTVKVPRMKTLRGWCSVYTVKVPRMKILRGWCSVYIVKVLRMKTTGLVFSLYG